MTIAEKILMNPIFQIICFIGIVLGLVGDANNYDFNLILNFVRDNGLIIGITSSLLIISLYNLNKSGCFEETKLTSE